MKAYELAPARPAGAFDAVGEFGDA
jgi:hypothetical protein